MGQPTSKYPTAMGSGTTNPQCRTRKAFLPLILTLLLATMLVMSPLSIAHGNGAPVVTITDVDTDRVYFDGNTLSFDIGFAAGPPGQIRVVLGVMGEGGGFESLPIFSTLSQTQIGGQTVHYADVPYDGSEATVTGAISNPSNTTLPAGVVGFKIYTTTNMLLSGETAIPVQMVPGPVRALVGVYIPAGDVSASPGLHEITNLYNTEQSITFTKAGLGSITFEPGLNIMGNSGELAALSNAIDISFVEATHTFKARVSTNAITFLANHDATIEFEGFEDKLGIEGLTDETFQNFLALKVFDNNNTLVDGSIVDYIDTTQMTYDPGPDLLTMPVKHFSSFEIDGFEPGQVRFASATYAADEAAGTATITVERVNGSDGTITVDYATSNGSAVAGTHYTTASGTLTFAEDATEAVFTITLAADDLVLDGNKIVNLTLSNPVGTSIVDPGTATLTIVDDEKVIQFAQGTADVFENAGTVTLTAKRLGNPAGAISATWTAAAGTASTDDFVAATGTVSWDAGDTADKTITVTITDDQIDEIDETFPVALSNPQGGATLGTPDTTSVTIKDWEPGIVQFDRTTSGAAEDSGNQIITLTRTGGTDGQVTVTVSLHGSSTASFGAAADFQVSPALGNRTFNPGEETQEITLMVNEDTTVEANETVVLTLSLPDEVANGVQLGADTTHTATIVNDDTAFSFAESAYNVVEANQTSVRINRNGATAGAASVSVTRDVSSTAVADTDYTTGPALGVINFGDGDSYKDITINTVGNNSPEGDRALVLALSAPSAGTNLGTPATTTVNIADDDTTFSFEQDFYTVSENTATTTITVRRNGSSSGTATVDFTYLVGGTATAGTDYTVNPVAGTLTFEEDETETDITVTITDDTSVEGNETVVFTLSDPTVESGQVSLPDADVTLTINDWEPGRISLGAATYNVNENGGTVDITITRTGGSDGQVSATCTTSGTATGADYTANPALGVVTFNSGDTASKTITITGVNDALAEGDETLTITLGSFTGDATAGANGSTTVTIADDDTAIRLSAATYSVAENGGTITITANRVGSTADAVGVSYATSNGTASAGTDYTAASGDLQFATGETTATFTITITDDTTYEGSETINVALSNTTGGATLGTPNTAVVTITDNESAPSSGGGGSSPAPVGVVIPASTGGSVGASDGRATVTLPRQSITQDVTVTVKPVTSPRPPAQGMVRIGNRVYEITCQTSSGAAVTTFNQAITLTFTFTQAELASAPPAALGVYYWDTALKTWIEVPSTVDAANGRVTAITDHLTEFALMAKPDALRLADIKGHWSEAHILKLVSLNVVNGYEDGSFKPEITITREQFAKMVVLAAGLQPEASPVLAFADADAISEWAKGYVAAAVKAGIINGVDGNRFAPREPVTRAQVATMVARALALQTPSTPTSFGDNSEIASWALGSIKAAVEKKIISGFEDNTFRPNLTATRAQAAKMLSEMIRVSVSK